LKSIKIKDIFSDDYFLNEAFRTVRTNIMFCCFDAKVLSFTSCNPSEGKSTISFEVAKSIAKTGKKVLFVDADMRKSKFMVKYTDENVEKGLSCFLSNQADIGEILYATDIDNLYIVTSGAYPPNPAELLAGSIFADFVKDAKENFDFVIIDTPPLGLVSDAMACISRSDGAVIIVSSEKTSLRHAKEIKKQISAAGVKIIGCILNNVHEKSKKYYYYSDSKKA
jgi:capsular exopolysaccharide synthesis family protein